MRERILLREREVTGGERSKWKEGNETKEKRKLWGVKGGERG